VVEYLEFTCVAAVGCMSLGQGHSLASDVLLCKDNVLHAEQMFGLRHFLSASQPCCRLLLLLLQAMISCSSCTACSACRNWL
jgi:hypothetical protein